MLTVKELSDEEEGFITPFLPSGEAKTWRPFVTLTYAQSLDSMISLGAGVRTTLSGPETKSMTHFLRLHHDAILIGAETAKADQPSLNCRYPGATLETQPQPLILGSSITDEWINESMAEFLAGKGKAKHPWRICNGKPEGDHSGWAWKDDKLVIKKDYDNSTKDWTSILEGLADRGIKSVMIEGGASIINTLLLHDHLVDSVIVTIAPTFLGREGVQVSPKSLYLDDDVTRENVATLEKLKWKQFGNDMVVCGKLKDGYDSWWERTREERERNSTWVPE